MKQPATDSKAEPGAAMVGVARGRVLSRRRKLLFRMAAAILLPVLALGAVEIGLRLGGYGHSTNFFRRQFIGNQEFLVNNDAFVLRFFPPDKVRLGMPLRMKAVKPPDTCRVFIFGESAALGEPSPAYGVGRYLEVLLREQFPGQRFEVVNVAITAINSHGILPLAKECARQAGDFWIIYMGNNEMDGPFGASTVFGSQAPPLELVRLSLAIQRTRVGQLLASLARRLQARDQEGPWGSLEMFLKNRLRPEDPRKQVVYRSYQRNLEDIVKAGLDSGAKVILNTMAVNLKDCSPLASMAATNLPAGERARYEQAYAAGCAAQEQGRFQEAAEHFAEASRLEPLLAELEFRWGQCLLGLGSYAEAREHLERACDYDATPARADSHINGLIRETGRRMAGPGLVLFDAARELETNNPAGICGQELFYEHVHFNAEGNYRLARAWAERIQAALPPSRRAGATGAWATKERCERQLGLTDWSRYFILQLLVRRFQEPPLNKQLNNGQRLETLRREMKTIEHKLDEIAAQKVCAVYAQAIQGAPDDYYLHSKFAEFLEARGDFRQALAEWQQVHGLLPDYYLALFHVGRLLAVQQKVEEAQVALAEAVRVRPDFSEGWLELGRIHTAEGQWDQACQDYAHARKLRPQDPRSYSLTAKVFAKSNRHAEAIREYRWAVQLAPEDWDSRYLLAQELAMTSQIEEARKGFEEVIRLKPDYAMAHLNLGVALVQEGRLDDALRQFEETLRLDPQNKFALNYLERARAARKRHL